MVYIFVSLKLNLGCRSWSKTYEHIYKMISKQKQPSKPKDKNQQKDVSMKSGNKYRFMQKQQDE